MLKVIFSLQYTIKPDMLSCNLRNQGWYLRWDVRLIQWFRPLTTTLETHSITTRRKRWFKYRFRIVWMSLFYFLWIKLVFWRMIPMNKGVPDHPSEEFPSDNHEKTFHSSNWIWRRVLKCGQPCSASKIAPMGKPLFWVPLFTSARAKAKIVTWEE